MLEKLDVHLGWGDEPRLNTSIKINFKWITDVKVLVKITRLLEENLGQNFHLLRLSKKFLKHQKHKP